MFVILIGNSIAELLKQRLESRAEKTTLKLCLFLWSVNGPQTEVLLFGPNLELSNFLQEFLSLQKVHCVFMTHAVMASYIVPVIREGRYGTCQHSCAINLESQFMHLAAFSFILYFTQKVIKKLQ